MQCPTCGTNTPATLGRCSNCDARLPAGPLETPLSAPVSADVEAIGDKTMMVPPPTPAWAPPPAAPGGLPPAPPSSLPPPPAPSDGPSPASSGGFPAASGALPPADPESTAAWTFDPDEDDDGPVPGAGGAPAGFGAASSPSPPPPPPPSWAGNGAGPSPYGTEPPAESIVPDSWFAPARTPDEQQIDANATMVVQGQPQDQTRFDGNATMLDQGMPHPNAPFPSGMDPNGMQPGSMHGGMQPGGMQPGGMQPGGFPANGGFQGPGGPMGPSGMPVDPAYGGQAPPRSSGGVSKPLIITVAVLVVVALVTVGLVVWPDGEKKNPPAAKPPATNAPNKKVSDDKPLPVATKQQAATVHALLNASADTRRVLTVAIGKTRKCEDLPAAMEGFQRVAQRRQNQLRRTAGLKLDRLKRGEQLRAALRQSFQGSLEADQALMAWAQQAQQGCDGTPKPDAAQAPGRAAAERKATLAKKQLVRLWNPIAKQAGHSQRRWNGV
ncbi:hypothetical protein SMC26_09705 [Actinomadura fulvescens]|uniref:Uncharacterized protein n=1 Tax=Actinomadura fulvescens TaxID=46160 RepID=A0ABN3Q601_9ACTN